MVGPCLGSVSGQKLSPGCNFIADSRHIVLGAAGSHEVGEFIAVFVF